AQLTKRIGDGSADGERHHAADYHRIQRDDETLIAHIFDLGCQRRRRQRNAHRADGNTSDDHGRTRIQPIGLPVENPPSLSISERPKGSVRTLYTNPPSTVLSA